MSGWWWLAFPILGFVFLIAWRAWTPLRDRWKEAALAHARREFRLRREALESKFLQLAIASGKPRGLRWADCDFAAEVVYARNRVTGELSAFVAVTIRFEAIPDGPLEDVAAVDCPRAATAVFHYDGRTWKSDGRAVFNLSPAEAIAHFRSEFEFVPMVQSRTA